MPNKPTNQRIISPKFYRLIKKRHQKDDEIIVFFISVENNSIHRVIDATFIDYFDTAT